MSNEKSKVVIVAIAAIGLLLITTIPISGSLTISNYLRLKIKEAFAPKLVSSGLGCINTITSSNISDFTVDSAVAQRNPTICNTIPNNGCYSDLLQNCYAKTAIVTRNRNLCNMIADSSDPITGNYTKRLCYATVDALTAGNASLCTSRDCILDFEIETQQTSNQCFGSQFECVTPVAMVARNPSTCDEISVSPIEFDARATCKAATSLNATYLNDNKICTELAGNYPFMQNICEAVAVSTRNLSICDNWFSSEFCRGLFATDITEEGLLLWPHE